MEDLAEEVSDAGGWCLEGGGEDWEVLVLDDLIEVDGSWMGGCSGEVSLVRCSDSEGVLSS